MATKKDKITLDLKEYNEIMQKILLLQNSITITHIDSMKNPMVKINLNDLKPILRNALKNSDYSNNYKVVENRFCFEKVCSILEKI